MHKGTKGDCVYASTKQPFVQKSFLTAAHLVGPLLPITRLAVDIYDNSWLVIVEILWNCALTSLPSAWSLFHCLKLGANSLINVEIVRQTQAPDSSTHVLLLPIFLPHPPLQSDTWPTPQHMPAPTFANFSRVSNLLTHPFAICYFSNS